MSANSDLITSDISGLDSARDSFITATNAAAEAAQKVLDLTAAGASFVDLQAANAVQRAAQQNAVAVHAVYATALAKLYADAAALPSGGDVIASDAAGLDSAESTFVTASNTAAKAAQKVQDLTAEGASFPILSAADAAQRTAQQAAIAAEAVYDTALTKLYTDAAVLA